MAAPSPERMGQITCQVWEAAMADRPAARLLPDGRVVLELAGAVEAIMAVEGVLRSRKRNGRPPGHDLATLAAVLAVAVPPMAEVLPEVHKCRAAAYAEAGLASAATPARSWLSGHGGGTPLRSHGARGPVGLHCGPPTRPPDSSRAVGHRPGERRGLEGTP